MKFLFKSSRVLMAVWKKIDISFGIPLPIVLDGSLLKYSSFSRGYHVYKDRWQTPVDDDYLHCEEEKDNKCAKHIVAKIYYILHTSKVVGHVPLYWSELVNKF